jgi:branched-chain amino acid aminotransferase
MIVYLDGAFIDAADAAIPIADRGFLHGDGIFETARLHRGRYFRLGDHLERLSTSAAVMHMPKPDHEQLAEIAAALAERNGLEEGSLRITLTRAADARTGSPFFGTMLVTLAPVGAGWQDLADRGWSIVTARTRRPAVDSVPAQLKGLGRPYALLARLEAQHAGADDALLLNSDGFIAEGPTWNVFWLSNGCIRTPGLDLGVLGGITRTVLLEAAAELGHEVEEGAWGPAELNDAEEIFASMSSVGVVSIISLDGRPLRGIRATAHALRDRYRQIVARECGGE